MPNVTSDPSPSRSVLGVASRTFPTALWTDSADTAELTRSIEFGAVGATCNPVIAVTAIRNHLDRWAPRILQLSQLHPSAAESELGWLILKEMSVEAAGLLRPAYEESGGRNGRLSIQTDPRLYRDTEALIRQAIEFSQLAENIIVKIPATSIGLPAIEEATFQGVSVNVTVSFTVAQAVASAQAIERGLERRAAAGLPEREFGSVVTLMGGRLDDWLKQWVRTQRILIDPGALEWAGVAALKRAYSIFVERGYRSRLLSAAFRNHMQWSQLVGADLVVSPPFDWQLLIEENQIEPSDLIAKPVNERILTELLFKVPEFQRAYDENGLTVAEFDSFGATINTVRQFLAADEDLDHLVRDVLLPAQ